jgi:hypothetical protein
VLGPWKPLIRTWVTADQVLPKKQQERRSGQLPEPACVRLSSMTFIADALGGWLVGQVASAGRKRLGDWLLGSEEERALQQAATAAIQATAEQFRPESAVADDAQSADHLARVIDHVFEKPPTPAESLTGHSTLLEGLQAGVAARLAALGGTCT